MDARYVLGILAAIFLFLGGARVIRDHGSLASPARTWLLIGVIFAAVSLWLWLSRPAP
jgi:hypothetical protein